MMERPSITATQIASFFDVTIENINSKIRTLKKKGIVERIGATKNGEWVVKTPK